MFKKFILAALIAFAPAAAFSQECVTFQNIEVNAADAGAKLVKKIEGKDTNAFKQAVIEISGADVKVEDVTSFDAVEVFYKEDAPMILFALFKNGCFVRPVFQDQAEAGQIMSRYSQLKVAAE